MLKRFQKIKFKYIKLFKIFSLLLNLILLFADTLLDLIAWLMQSVVLIELPILLSSIPLIYLEIHAGILVGNFRWMIINCLRITRVCDRF